jgi:hypothetical protein
LRLWVNEATTGHTRKTLAGEVSFAEFLRKNFSRKSKLNPIYLTAFVLLACPWRWKLQNAGRVWARNLRFMLQRRA